MAQNTFEILVEFNTTRARRQVGEFNRTLDNSSRSLNRASGGFATLGRAAGALGAIVGAGALGKAFLDTNRRVQQLQNSLKIVTGSAKAGQDAFKQLQDVAVTTPFNVDQLGESFIKLRAAGIEPTNELLTRFADVASVTTDSVGTLQAITDLYARTTAGGLGLEDLNRLADRGVPVFDILSKRLGVTRLQLSKLGQTSEGAQIIIRNLEEGFKRFAGSAEEASKTLDGSISNLGQAFDNVLIAFGGAGINEIAQGALNSLSDLLNGITDEAEQLGGFVQLLARDFQNFAKEALASVDTALGDVDDGFVDVLTSAVTFDNVLAGIRLGFVAFTNTIKIGIETISIFFKRLGGELGIIAGALVEAFPQAITKISEFFLALGRGIQETLSRIKNNVISFGEGLGAAIDAILDFEDPRKAFAEKFKPISLTDVFDFSDVPEIKTGFDEAFEELNKETAVQVEQLNQTIKDNINLGTLVSAPFSESARQQITKFISDTKTQTDAIVQNTKVVEENNKAKEESAATAEEVARAQELVASTTDKASKATEEQNKQIERSFENLGQAVGRFATGTKDAIRGVIAELIRLAAIKLFGGTNPFVSGFLTGFGEIRGFANGGNFNAGETFVVGERGPELITANAPGTVIPDIATRNMGGVSMNVSFTVNGSVNGVDELDLRFEQFASAIAENTNSLLRNQLRTGGVLA